MKTIYDAISKPNIDEIIVDVILDSNGSGINDVYRKIIYTEKEKNQNYKVNCYSSFIKFVMLPLFEKISKVSGFVANK